MSVTIRAIAVRETGRAICVDLDGARHWLPKAQIEAIDGEVSHEGGLYDGQHHAFTVSDWIAVQKGFVLEREVFVASTQTGHVVVSVYSIKAGTEVMGYSTDKKKADMIAAALNLTIGRV